MQRELTESIIAVVGATGGLGSAIATALRSSGATVVTVGRNASSDVHLDIRDAGAGDTLVEHIRSAHAGRLDGVVIAAGIVAFGEVADTDDVVVEELLLTNAMGPLWLARRVAPLLAESQGFIANISGVVAETPMPSMVAYSASKAAASAGFAALAKEWRRRKIDVIDLRPPHTETGLATRPLAGTAPTMPTGLTASAVADRIVAAIVAGERSVSGADFGNGQRSADRPT